MIGRQHKNSAAENTSLEKESASAVIKKPQKSNRTLFYKIAKLVAMFLCVVLIPIIVVNLVLIVKSFLYPDKVPDFLGYKAFVVNSGSMDAESATAPRIKIGDFIICKVIEPESLKVNDTIAYKLSSEVVLHQIIEQQTVEGKTYFIAKGTNNNTPDPRAVAAEQVEGIYLLRIPKVGSFAMLLQSPLGISLFVVIPIILFILYDILIRTRQQKKLKSKEEELREEIERLKAQNATTVD